MNLILIIVLNLFLVASAVASEVVAIADLDLINKQYVIKDLKDDGSYEVSSGEDVFKYKYDSFDGLVLNIKNNIHLSSKQKIIILETLQLYHYLSKGRNIPITYLIKASNQMMDELYEVGSVKRYIDCVSEKEPQEVAILNEESKFYELGDLVAIESDLITGNDNIGHGGIKAEAKGNWFEGDDKGLTVYLKQAVKAHFETGHVAFSVEAKGYGRITPVTTTDPETGEVSTTIKDQEGKRYQNFISIDEYVFEIQKDFKTDKTYVRLLGKYITKKDRQGIAKNAQESWHKGKKIEYRYLEHLPKNEKGYALGVDVGKEFVWVQNPQIKISSTVEVGAQIANQENDREAHVYADLSVDYGSKGNGIPSAQLMVHGNMTRDFGHHRNYRSYGILMRKNFQVTDNTYVGIKAGLNDEEDYYAHEYGKEEKSEKLNNGKLDLIHYYGIDLKYFWQ